MIYAVYFGAIAVFTGWETTWEHDPVWQAVMFVATTVFASASAWFWHDALKEEKQQTHQQK